MSADLPFVESLARQAGAVLRDGYGRAGAIDFKGAVDLVTEFDHQSEALIVAGLRRAFPEHAIRAEEGSGHQAEGDYEWLVDPLDGTTNFAHAVPIFAVSIALAERGRLILGVVYDPMRDELFAAEAGRGARLNGRPLHVSSTSDLGRGLLATGFPYDVRTNPHDNFAEFERFYRRSQAVRRLGAAALDCCYVAAGRFDGYWEFHLKPWDVAAGALIVREAGGRVTDADGGDDFLGRASIIASNGHLHPAMLRVLRDGDLAPPA